MSYGFEDELLVEQTDLTEEEALALGWVPIEPEPEPELDEWPEPEPDEWPEPEPDEWPEPEPEGYPVFEAVGGGPPHVIRGADCARVAKPLPPDRPEPVGPPLVVGPVQFSRRSISPDWIRMTGPDGAMPEVLRYLAELGLGDGEAGRGRHYYEASVRYLGGAVSVLYGGPHVRSTCCVEFTGSALAPMPERSRWEVLRRLHGFGLKASRIDLAVDHTVPAGSGAVGLVAAMAAAWERDAETGVRQITGAKHGEYRRPERADGELEGHSMTFGRRGADGSGRYVRVYDKGLETGEAAAGEWERYEVEFTGSVAAAVAQEVAWAEDPATEALAWVKGAIDVREATTAYHLCDRPMLGWWEAFWDVESKRATAKRRTPTLESFRRWFRKAVAPSLYDYASLAGVSAADAMCELIAGLPLPDADVVRAFVWEAEQSGRVAELRDRAGAWARRRELRRKGLLWDVGGASVPASGASWSDAIAGLDHAGGACSRPGGRRGG